MSISDSEVETAGLPSVVTVARAALDSDESAPSQRSASAAKSGDEPSASLAPPYRTISDHELTLVQICSDFICACIALPLALILLSRVSSVAVNAPSQLLTNIKIDSLFPLTVVLALALGGVYRVTHRRLQPSAFLEIREVSFGVGCGCVLALAIGSLLHGLSGTTEPYATQLDAAVIVTIGVVTLGRMVMRLFLHALATTRVLVVGAGAAADRIMLSVRQDPGMTLVGRVIDGERADAGAIGRVSDLPALCPQLDVHRLLVTAHDEVSPESLDIYRQLQDLVYIAMVPRYYELISWRSRLTDLSGMPVLEIAQPHLSAWDKCTKRFFDLVVSSAVLVLTLPLMLVVAIGVKLSSPGPVFFRQVRLGRNAEPFTVIKFRSMTVGGSGPESRAGSDGESFDGESFDGESFDGESFDGESFDGESFDGDSPDAPSDETDQPLYEVRHKTDESARITRFGAFLRHAGIDEIPQFINVFKGDMSVVGPRPFVPSESDVQGWEMRRFEVRPGITGLWQVSGRNDLTRYDLVQLDHLYVASWSLWWDLKIMVETPKTMARGIGAY